MKLCNLCLLNPVCCWNSSIQFCSKVIIISEEKGKRNSTRHSMTLLPLTQINICLYYSYIALFPQCTLSGFYPLYICLHSCPHSSVFSAWLFSSASDISSWHIVCMWIISYMKYHNLILKPNLIFHVMHMEFFKKVQFYTDMSSEIAQQLCQLIFFSF